MKVNRKLDILKYKGIIFDRDGTLFDSNGVMSNADDKLIHVLGAKLRQPIPDEWADFYRNFTGNEDISLVWAKHLINIYNLESITPERYLENRNTILNDIIRILPYKEDADKLLLMLKNIGISLAMVTLGSDNSMELYHHNEIINATAPINLIFNNNIITSDFVKLKNLRQKPEPDPNLLALKMLGLRPEECLVFEDSLIGLISAQRAGIDTCIIYDSHSDKDREELERGTPYHINNFSELFEYSNFDF